MYEYLVLLNSTFWYHFHFYNKEELSAFCRASVLFTVIETMRGFVETNEGLSSFPEIFQPLSALLEELVQLGNLPVVLRDKFLDVSKQIKKKVDEVYLMRKPLQMRKKKPMPIKQLNPKFEEK